MRIRFLHPIVVDRIEFKGGDEVEVLDGDEDITPGQLTSLINTRYAEEIMTVQAVTKPEATSAPAKKETAKN